MLPNSFAKRRSRWSISGRSRRSSLREGAGRNDPQRSLKRYPRCACPEFIEGPQLQQTKNFVNFLTSWLRYFCIYFLCYFVKICGHITLLIRAKLVHISGSFSCFYQSKRPQFFLKNEEKSKKTPKNTPKSALRFKKNETF